MSNKTTITINDDFDLFKIMNSGQAFRIVKDKDDFYRFVSGQRVLYIRHISKENDPNKGSSFELEVFNALDGSAKCENEWNDFWKNYFDMGRNYGRIRKNVPGSDPYMNQACDNGQGLRILRQDPWEMLITFITSQRKSIPAIKDAIEHICSKYGKKIDTEKESLYLFPSAKEMEKATEEELKDCKLGYRVSYCLDAVKKVLSGELDLKSLYASDYETVFEKLKEVKGVGDKVSNCICLFAYSKTEAAPVDTWISKVIEQKYTGVNPFPSYGDVAGIMQQYIFYYALTHKDSL